MNRTDETERGTFETLFPIKTLTMSTDGVFRADSEEDIELHGITVFGECTADDDPDPVIPELLKRAKAETTESSGKVSLVLIGDGITAAAPTFFTFGADRIFVYDDPSLRTFPGKGCLAVLRHFLSNYKPDSILGTNNTIGRTLLAGITKPGIEFSEKPLFRGNSSEPKPDLFGELILCEIPESLS